MVLDVAGMVPVIGNAADLINLCLSLGRGNYSEAALNAASMIPGSQLLTGAKLAIRSGRRYRKAGRMRLKRREGRERRITGRKGKANVRTVKHTKKEGTPVKSINKPSYTIGANDGGPGKWALEKESITKFKPFERKVTGSPSDEHAYIVEKIDPGKTGNSYVKFDGYDPERNVLLDAKQFNDFPKIHKGDILGKKSVIKQAKSQIATNRNGASIEWHIDSVEKANLVRRVLRREGIKNIKIVSPPIFLK